MNNSQLQREKILSGNIPSLITTMAIPSIIMQLINLVYNTADTYFIAQINKSAAAAVGTVFSIQALIQAIGFGFGMGVSSLCSRKLGESNDTDADTIANSGILGAFICALVLEILGILFMKPILRIIGCTESMMPYARSYAVIILAFAPMTCVSYVIGNIFKSEGHIKYATYGNVTGAIINVFLDPVLIFVFNMGTLGAAMATSISQLITLIIFAYQFYRGKTVITLSLKKISRHLEVYLQIITTGIPTVFRQGLASLAMALLCKQASVYGDAAVAAVTISNKCYMLVRNIVLGIGQGAQPVAGYNYGAGKLKRTKESYDFAIKVGSVICVTAGIVMYIFSSEIMWWFCKDTEVLEYGVRALHYACLVMPLMAVSTYVNQEYQCLGFKKQATFLASCRQGLCFVPVIMLLPAMIGVTGVEVAQPVADFITFLISIPFYIKMSHHLLTDTRSIVKK